MYNPVDNASDRSPQPDNMTTPWEASSLLSVDVGAIAAMMCELMGMMGTNGEVVRR